MVSLKEFGFSKFDVEEKARGDKQKFVTLDDYPKPLNRFKLIQEKFNQSIEEMYFWLINSLRDDWGLWDVKKVKDVFSASEMSAIWGQAQQRLSIQQGNVSNYLQTIGKLLKDLFNIVREIRILKERLSLYDESNEAIRDDMAKARLNNPAEIALRGYWVDLKDGGAKSPASVYGMAANLGFSTLPDLFFAAPAMKNAQVADYVDSLQFNRKVREVLGRKLKQFIVWKEATYTELKTRENFVLRYLRQHYNSIQLYLDWVKPYLRNVKKLSMNYERSISEDLIGAFEGSVVEIEVICRDPHGEKDYTKEDNKQDTNSIVLLSIYFRTRPSMDFHAEGYQHKGPVHVGRTELTLRSYAWTNEELDNFLKFKEAKDLELIGSIDSGIQDALDALGDELKTYLRESHGEKLPEDIKKEALDAHKEKNSKKGGRKSRRKRKKKTRKKKGGKKKKSRRKRKKKRKTRR